MFMYGYLDYQVLATIKSNCEFPSSTLWHKSSGCDRGIVISAFVIQGSWCGLSSLAIGIRWVALFLSGLTVGIRCVAFLLLYCSCLVWQLESSVLLYHCCIVLVLSDSWNPMCCFLTARPIVLVLSDSWNQRCCFLIAVLFLSGLTVGIGSVAFSLLDILFLSCLTVCCFFIAVLFLSGLTVGIAVTL
jgi:hypothetical protein